MKRSKTLALLATTSLLSVSGYALFNSDWTTAQWKGEKNLPNVQIVSGNLDVNAIGSITWTNPSNPDGEVTKVLPGETTVGLQAADFAIAGKNMQAQVYVKLVGSLSTSAVTPPSGYSIMYRVLDKNSNPLTDYTSINNSPSSPAAFTEANVTSQIIDGVADFFIEVSVTYPDSEEVEPGDIFNGNYMVEVNQI